MVWGHTRQPWLRSRRSRRLRGRPRWWSCLRSLQREVWRCRGGNAGVLDQVKPKALRERLLKVWAKW